MTSNMPDIITTIATSAAARSLSATVALTRAQADRATFGATLEISPDDGAHWFFAASSAFAGSPGWTDRAAGTNWSIAAESPSLPAPATHVRLRLTDPSDATLAATLEAL